MNWPGAELDMDGIPVSAGIKTVDQVMHPAIHKFARSKMGLNFITSMCYVGFNHLTEPEAETTKPGQSSCKSNFHS